jgi:hypothetical protein
MLSLPCTQNSMGDYNITNTMDIRQWFGTPEISRGRTSTHSDHISDAGENDESESSNEFEAYATGGSLRNKP